jgi:hypothetical protein
VTGDLQLALDAARRALTADEVTEDDLRMTATSLGHFSGSLVTKGLATLIHEILDGDQAGALQTSIALLVTAAEVEAEVEHLS